MTPWYQSPDGSIELYLGDCANVFPALSGLSAIVVDGPSGTGFMNRDWDKAKGSAYGQSVRRSRLTEQQRRIEERNGWIEYWAKRFSIAREACIPDHIAFFWSLPRTQHWSGCAVEDAGYRIVDTLTTINGQGWPKTPGSLRPCKEEWIIGRSGSGLMDREECRVTRGGENRKTGGLRAPGYGSTSIGTAYEPDERGSLPCNIALGHCGGDGGLQCRAVGVRKVKASGESGLRSKGCGYGGGEGRETATPAHGQSGDGTESLPAYECRVACRTCGNEWLALSGGDAPRCACGSWCEFACPVAAVDAQTGTLHPPGNLGAIMSGQSASVYGAKGSVPYIPAKDEGGGSRFFNRLDSLDASLAYFAKCPAGERHMGCENLHWKVAKKDPFGFVQVSRVEWEALGDIDRTPRSDGKSDAVSMSLTGSASNGQRAQGNSHPTTKRISAMRHIHRLAGSSRPGWHVGDPCVGSGTGALAALLDGVRYTGTEICEQALVIARARIEFILGLSDSAREALRRDEQPPIPSQPIDERQRSLF